MIHIKIHVKKENLTNLSFPLLNVTRRYQFQTQKWHTLMFIMHASWSYVYKYFDETHLLVNIYVCIKNTLCHSLNNTYFD